MRDDPAAIWHELSRPVLVHVATDLREGRLAPPFQALHLVNYAPREQVEAIALALTDLDRLGMTPTHIAHLLTLLAAEKLHHQRDRDQTQLVWTGYELASAECRDTAVVVRELIEAARSRVWLASFAIDSARKAPTVFRTLADCMDRNPALQVRMFLNLHCPKPPYQVQRVVRDFTQTFRQQLWPGKRLPEVFYYPPSLDIGGSARSCLHVKCLIVDDLRLLVTSANFTEAAQERNLEAGVVMTDAIAAQAMRRQFEGMIAQKVLERIL